MKKLLAILIAWGPSGLFLLSVLDGAGLTIPGGVDALIVYLASRKPDSALLLSLVTVLGSTAGNLILFLLARKGGEAYLHRHTLSRGGAQFRRWFQHYGLLTVFIAALVPLPIMPMKIFVLCSGALGVKPHAFVLTFIGARIPRYLGLAYLGASMGEDALLYLRQHLWQLAVFAVALAAVLFVIVKIHDYRRARAVTAPE
jgi:membrane protein YqaA with SNARE-associated domain